MTLGELFIGGWASLNASPSAAATLKRYQTVLDDCFSSVPLDRSSESFLERRRGLEPKLPLSLRRVQATAISNQPLERCPGLAKAFRFLFDCELANFIAEPPPVILDP